MDGNLSKFKVKIKRGREATSVGILKGTCTFEWGVGQSPICKCLRRAGSPRGHTKLSKLSLKNLEFPLIRVARGGARGGQRPSRTGRIRPSFWVIVIRNIKAHLSARACPE